VLTVREGAPLSMPPQRILVPVDLSPYSEGLLRYAGVLAGLYGARLDLLHVVEPLPSGGAFSGALPALEYTKLMQGRAREHLLELVGKTSGSVPETRLHVEGGHAAAGILDFAERTGADMIVLATQGRSGIERFLIGSVAERVVRTAPCLVLTVKVKVAPVAAEAMHQTHAMA
jgi:nucleotide-binding universal stress UspA family protein